MTTLLSQFLRDAAGRLGKGRLTKKGADREEAFLRRCLLEADVSVGVARRVAKNIVGKAVAGGKGDVREFVGRIFLEELESTLEPCGAKRPLLNGKIMVVGLNGAGKTTTSGKLARWVARENPGTSVGLAACDLRRPGAVRQLEILAGKAGVEFFDPGDRTLEAAIDESKLWGDSLDTAIYDMAGRQDTEDGLIEELSNAKKALAPDAVLLVCDAAAGQQAGGTAETFSKAVGVDGVVVTKLDGDALGGAVLTIVESTGAPVLFCGTGEKLDDLSPFCPKRMAKRIMGHGDLAELVRTIENSEEEGAADGNLGEMGFDEFLSNLKMIRSLGPLDRIAALVPGGGHSAFPLDERRFSHIEALVFSMTPEERKKPDLLTCSERQERVANGAGLDVGEVKEMLGRFNRMRELLS